VIRRAPRAGVDAVIVQDLGVARLARAIAPDAADPRLDSDDLHRRRVGRARPLELGADRVILARELSLDEIAAIRARRRELEVFVHGALCVSYSGQCLTSEAIGGRSANRGACAQACRLPYELVVDGVLRDRATALILLSPEDLEASALVPELVELGVSSLKIEGRLKGPEYVAAATRLYRRDRLTALGASEPRALAAASACALQTCTPAARAPASSRASITSASSRPRLRSPGPRGLGVRSAQNLPGAARPPRPRLRRPRRLRPPGRATAPLASRMRLPRPLRARRRRARRGRPTAARARSAAAYGRSEIERRDVERAAPGDEVLRLARARSSGFRASSPAAACGRPTIPP
jgi:hypothetical protein